MELLAAFALTGDEIGLLFGIFWYWHMESTDHVRETFISQFRWCFLSLSHAL